MAPKRTSTNANGRTAGKAHKNKKNQATIMQFGVTKGTTPAFKAQPVPKPSKPLVDRKVSKGNTDACPPPPVPSFFSPQPGFPEPSKHQKAPKVSKDKSDIRNYFSSVKPNESAFSAPPGYLEPLQHQAASKVDKKDKKNASTKDYFSSGKHNAPQNLQDSNANNPRSSYMGQPPEYQTYHPNQVFPSSQAFPAMLPYQSGSTYPPSQTALVNAAQARTPFDIALSPHTGAPLDYVPYRDLHAASTSVPDTFENGHQGDASKSLGLSPFGSAWSKVPKPNAEDDTAKGKKAKSKKPSRLHSIKGSPQALNSPPEYPQQPDIHTMTLLSPAGVQSDHLNHLQEESKEAKRKQAALGKFFGKGNKDLAPLMPITEHPEHQPPVPITSRDMPKIEAQSPQKDTKGKRQTKLGGWLLKKDPICTPGEVDKNQLAGGAMTGNPEYQPFVPITEQGKQPSRNPQGFQFMDKSKFTNENLSPIPHSSATHQMTGIGAGRLPDFNMGHLGGASNKPAPVDARSSNKPQSLTGSQVSGGQTGKRNGLLPSSTAARSSLSQHGNALGPNSKETGSTQNDVPKSGLVGGSDTMDRKDEHLIQPSDPKIFDPILSSGHEKPPKPSAFGGLFHRAPKPKSSNKTEIEVNEQNIDVNSPFLEKVQGMRADFEEHGKDETNKAARKEEKRKRREARKAEKNNNESNTHQDGENHAQQEGSSSLSIKELAKLDKAAKKAAKRDRRKDMGEGKNNEPGPSALDEYQVGDHEQEGLNYEQGKNDKKSRKEAKHARREDRKAEQSQKGNDSFGQTGDLMNNQNASPNPDLMHQDGIQQGKMDKKTKKAARCENMEAEEGGMMQQLFSQKGKFPGNPNAWPKAGEPFDRHQNDIEQRRSSFDMERDVERADEDLDRQEREVERQREDSEFEQQRRQEEQEREHRLAESRQTQMDRKGELDRQRREHQRTQADQTMEMREMAMANKREQRERENERRRMQEEASRADRQAIHERKEEQRNNEMDRTEQDLEMKASRAMELQERKTEDASIRGERKIAESERKQRAIAARDQMRETEMQMRMSEKAAQDEQRETARTISEQKRQAKEERRERQRAFEEEQAEQKRAAKEEKRARKDQQAEEELARKEQKAEEKRAKMEQKAEKEHAQMEQQPEEYGNDEQFQQDMQGQEMDDLGMQEDGFQDGEMGGETYEQFDDNDQ
ncbi:hypothetical protein P280DRAFT_518041 [Massarina eburnea CBS 473.64]|uniref:Uncharacterized protein n=1 Tax=Massarina eburnea CBS 473.64 TaxID=1395130 RepID=A0A6A6S1Y1_9PLEO|nr:hypothetical protein P280DRAFT_518041 [Massarina eburnea CBS 473.64]